MLSKGRRGGGQRRLREEDGEDNDRQILNIDIERTTTLENTERGSQDVCVRQEFVNAEEMGQRTSHSHENTKLVV